MNLYRLLFCSTVVFTSLLSCLKASAPEEDSLFRALSSSSVSHEQLILHLRTPSPTPSFSRAAAGLLSDSPTAVRLRRERDHAGIISSLRTTRKKITGVNRLGKFKLREKRSSGKRLPHLGTPTKLTPTKPYSSKRKRITQTPTYVGLDDSAYSGSSWGAEFNFESNFLTYLAGRGISVAAYPDRTDRDVIRDEFLDNVLVTYDRDEANWTEPRVPQPRSVALILKRIAINADHAYPTIDGIGVATRNTHCHTYCQRVVEHLQRQYNRFCFLKLEHSYLNKKRVKFSAKGSVRPDVYWPEKKTVFDYKFAEIPKITTREINAWKLQLPVPPKRFMMIHP